MRDQTNNEQFLEKANIVPSYDRTYSLADIEDALKEGHGADVTVRCHYQSLNEIWYHFNVAGRLQTGEFVPTSPGMSNLRSQTLLPKSDENFRKQDGPKSNCPKTGIHYKPKRSKPPSTTTSAPSDPTRSPSNGRGHLQVYTLNQKRGCIISKSTWFSSGTCATFRINRASGKGSLKANLREKTILTRSLKPRRFHPPIKKGTLCFLQRHLQLQQSRPKPHCVHGKQIPSVHPPI